MDIRNIIGLRGGWGGVMVDDFCHINMTKNKSHLDLTLKKVHTEESVMQVVRSQTFNIYIQMAKVFCGQFI